MFGPLNGPRIALVIGYALAALAALALGQWIVAALFGVGIVAHGWLWWRMYQDRRPLE